MAYEQKPNTGSLFKNDRRERDSQPSARGTALIEGVAFWVSAWTNEARDGSKYQSLKFERKDSDRDNTHEQHVEAIAATGMSGPDDLDDSIPF